MGTLIAFEGVDGSGKGTQANMLMSTLSQRGESCELFSFPEYESNLFGHEVASYLNGELGNLDEIHPKLIAMLYAADRLESLSRLENAIGRCRFVICDRFTPSNIAHQGAKLTEPERDQLREWVETVEYQIFRIPQPDTVVLLDVAPKVAFSLVAKKNQRVYTEKLRDLHEGNYHYLEMVHNYYRELAQAKKWTTVDCTRHGRIRSADDIHEEIVARVIDSEGMAASS